MFKRHEDVDENQRWSPWVTMQESNDHVTATYAWSLQALELGWVTRTEVSTSMAINSHTWKWIQTARKLKWTNTVLSFKKEGNLSLSLNHKSPVHTILWPTSSFTNTEGWNGWSQKSVHLGGIYENLVPYPLNFYTFDPIYVVTFLISCKILWILRGSWVNILCILCHLHSFRLGSGLVTELNQGHQHGQTESSDQNVEDSSHVAQAESARLLLQMHTRHRSAAGPWRRVHSFINMWTWIKKQQNISRSQQKLKEMHKNGTTISSNNVYSLTANIIYKSTRNHKTNNMSAFLI